MIEGVRLRPHLMGPRLLIELSREVLETLAFCETVFKIVASQHD